MDTATVRDLLDNKKLKIIIDSPDNTYCFEYFSTISIDRWTKERRLVRTYRLIDKNSSQIISEPWDAYDLDKQTVLVNNLIALSRYQITKITGGWQATCPSCGQVTRHGHWQNPPSKCHPEPKSTKKCQYLFKLTDINEIIYNEYLHPKL